MDLRVRMYRRVPVSLNPSRPPSSISSSSSSSSTLCVLTSPVGHPDKPVSSPLSYNISFLSRCPGREVTCLTIPLHICALCMYTYVCVCVCVSCAMCVVTCGWHSLVASRSKGAKKRKKGDTDSTLARDPSVIVDEERRYYHLA
ncbi:hypothetical protein Micbo1qcDRAFT_165193, partial [Microdochium bolleyi]